MAAKQTITAAAVNKKPKVVTGDPELVALRTLASVLLERAALAGRLGKSFGTDRDLYKALGYIKSPTFQDYNSRYQRQDIAGRVVDAPVNASWRKKPIITEGTEDVEPTEFEKAWAALAREKKIWHYLVRADKISGIGRFGILLLGFDDGRDLSQEVVGTSNDLLYLQAYHEGSVEIESIVRDAKDSRYGLPLEYKVKMARGISPNSTESRRVHWSRVIHIAEGLVEGELYGTPRLKRILNRLIDLERVAGGSSEMFWRGAYPGMAFIADREAQFGPQDKEALEDEIQEYMHHLRRYLRLQGMKVESLQPQVADPSKHFDVLISLISCATGIPKRILLGSERGKLSSVQDERNWSSRVDERRRDYVEPTILRPFIDRLVQVGVLPEPQEGPGQYEVVWPDLSAPTAKEEAEVGRLKMDALNKYMSTPGADLVFPPQMFLQQVLGLTQEEVEQAWDMVQDEGQLATEGIEGGEGYGEEE